MEKKQTKGRQKIEMKRISNEEDRLITFSKRRSGIYKKASELSTLCGAEVGVLVFSPAGKAFSFGHPSIETITNKIFYENPPPNDGTLNLVEAHRRFRLNELHQKYSEVLGKMEAAKEQEKILRKKVPNRSKGWWEKPINELGMHELEQMAANIQMLHKQVQQRANELRTRGSSSSLSFSVVNQTHPTNPFSMAKVEQKY